MAKIEEIVDSKEQLISSDVSDPGFPSVKQMRKTKIFRCTIRKARCVDWSVI